MASAKRRANQVNDLDLSNWKQYDDIFTDSLWMLDSRDSSGAHQADYHGNFIPQIPNQLLRRFTKPGDVVLDPFIGSGTTGMEANRLGRRYIGVELSPSVADLARQRIHDDRGTVCDSPYSECSYTSIDNESIITGDSSSLEISEGIAQYLKGMEKDNVQFILMHPPYHNIVKFSDDLSDLSNCTNADDFLERFMSVYSNISDFLQSGRHLAVVIGDIYANSEWVPLQNLITSKLLSTNELKLKSIIVKNMVNNRAKRNQENLWRYRALANGFYIFKHEYIVLFQNIKGVKQRKTRGKRNGTD